MKWTKDDLEILREIYPINPKYCAEILERDVKAVGVKANSLGIKSNKAPKVLTHEEYEAKLPSTIKVLEQYKGTVTELLHECLKCGEHFVMTPRDILYDKPGCAPRTGCPDCRSNKLTEKEVRSRIPEGYALMESYRDQMNKHRFKHLICGHEWETKPHDVFNGTRCPQCAGKNSNIVYLAYFPELQLYKLGVSSNPQRRSYQFGHKCDILWIEEYPSYIEATAREKELLEGVKLVNTGLLKSGNTETFYEINDKIRRL
jgi:hypothetical protein